MTPGADEQAILRAAVGRLRIPQDIPERFVPHSDTWFYSRVAGTFKERGGWHGCQMPEQLLGRIIKACSNEGDIILDPFAGSGTTPAVAKKLNRRYLACELSEEYARNVKKRLAKIKPGDPLDGPEHAALSAPRTKAGRRLKRKESPARPHEPHGPVATKVNGPLKAVAAANGEIAQKGQVGSAEYAGGQVPSRSCGHETTLFNFVAD